MESNSKLITKKPIFFFIRFQQKNLKNQKKRRSRSGEVVAEKS